jgi:hypothetical protein
LQDAYWREAFKRWGAVLEDERFWSRLDGRVAELNDPRLTAETARQLRTALPLLVLLTNAHLAARAVAAGDKKEAARQKQLMRGSGFDDEASERALRRAARHIVERVRTLCVASGPEAEAAPGLAEPVIRRLLSESGALIRELENLLPGDPLPGELRDEVALCALNCLVAFAQEPGALRAALALLERARPFANSSGVRERANDLRAHLLRSTYQQERARAAEPETR